MGRLVTNVNSELLRLASTGRCLTAGKLAAILGDCDPDAVVLLASDYGDYHHTEQALPVTKVDDTNSRYIGPTTYSASGLCTLDEPRGDFDSVPVVILNTGGNP